jgi:putative ABC transport system permease protein
MMASYILVFLNRPFLQMSLYAFALAVPFSVYVMKLWMVNFKYHTEMEWWLFLVCFVLLSIVTLATISYHSVKLVKVNPVDSLKYE